METHLRTLIAIKGCEAHRDRYEAQKNTWIAGHRNCIFFTGAFLGVPDDYEHLPEKTKAMCQWAWLEGYDWAFFVDTDTYVRVDRLLASDYKKYDYSGYVLDTLAIPYCSGPHYWLSRVSMDVLAHADWAAHAVPGYVTCEDVMVGSVLRAHAILPHHDPRYAPFDPVLPGNDLISQHLSSRKAFEIPMMYSAHEAAHAR